MKANDVSAVKVYTSPLAASPSLSGKIRRSDEESCS
jgi:hypothetical protein